MSCLTRHPGWCQSKGWLRLKDKLPIHEASSPHVKNYIAWKNAIRAAKGGKLIDSLLFDQLNQEHEKWKTILSRVLTVILFMAERGLALRGSQEKIGDPTNGNFLGFMEVLAKFDPILGDHVNNIKASQENPGTRMPAHYMSKTIQNELIEVARSFVLDNIVNEVKKAKYFAITVDGTPDISHDEQISFVLRYLLHNGSSFSIEERFISFENFSKKTGHEIARKIVGYVGELGLQFEDCIGQTYDNGSNMSGKYNGARAVITAEYADCLYSSCANHTLNLVGVECAKSCRDAVTFFGVIQRLYTIFSGSPTRWEILKHIGVSLHQTSTTRWSARIDAVRPIARHFDNIRKAVDELTKATNLTPECRADIIGIKTYFQTFESLIMASIWVKVLSAIHDTNLVIQYRDATLDVERDNIKSLLKTMQDLRENWPQIVNEATIVATNVQLTSEFAKRRRGDSQEEAKNNFKTDVFYVIIDSIISGLTQRFEAVVTICNRFDFLWCFQDIKEIELREKAAQFHITYSRHVSPTFNPRFFL